MFTYDHTDMSTYASVLCIGPVETLLGQYISPRHRLALPSRLINNNWRVDQ